MITLYAQFTSNKLGKTGLTVELDIYRDGVLILTDESASELGGGVYMYELGEEDELVAGQYVGIFKTTDATVDLKEIPHLVGDVAGAVWSNYSRTLTTPVVPSVVEIGPNKIFCKRGDTLVLTLTGLGSLANRSKLYFTVKDDPVKTDAQAIIQIEETAGLLRLNGAAGTALDGSITVDNAGAGDITIRLAAGSSKSLPYKRLYYDVQIVRSIGTPVSTLNEGAFIVSADITAAVS